MLPFYTPWKRQKTTGFPTFSEGIERKHWPEMGEDLYSAILYSAIFAFEFEKKVGLFG